MSEVQTLDPRTGQLVYKDEALVANFVNLAGRLVTASPVGNPQAFRRRALTNVYTVPVALRPRTAAAITWGANGSLDSNSDVTNGKYGAVYDATYKRWVIKNQNFKAPAPGTPAFRIGVQYGSTASGNLVTLPLLFLNCNFQGWGRDVDMQSVGVVFGAGQCDLQFEECMWLPLYPYNAVPSGITAGFPGLAINTVNAAYLGYNHCEFYFIAGVRMDGFSASAFTNTGYARPFLARWNKFRNVDCRKHDNTGAWLTGSDTSNFFACGMVTFLNCRNMPDPLMEFTDAENDPVTGARSEDLVSVYQSTFPDGHEFKYRYFRHKNFLTYDPLYTGSQQYILRKADGSRISFSGTSGNLGDGVCYPDSSYKWSAGNLTPDMFPRGVLFENGIVINSAHFGLAFTTGNRQTVRNVALVSAGAIRSSHPSGYSIIHSTASDSHGPWSAWDYVNNGTYDSTYPAAGDARYFKQHVMDGVLVAWYKVADVAAQTVTPVGPYIPTQVSADSMTYLNVPATPATPSSVLNALTYVDGIETGWIASIASAAAAKIGCSA